MQFQYAKKIGGLGTIEAPDQATALRMLPADADPSSGIMGGLSGTGTPAPGAGSSLPGSTPGLPETPASGNNLLDFKNMLSTIDAAAKQNRNAFVPGLASSVPAGTLNASSFGDIVSMLNRGTDTFRSETSKNAMDAFNKTSSDILTTTADNGAVSGIDKATGKVLWTTPPGTGNVQTPGGGTLAERSAQALSSYSNAFTTGHYLPSGIPTIDSEGFITPEAWKSAIDEAPSKGLTRADFIKQFGYMITTQGQVSPKYGLTPVEIKLLLGSGGVANPWAQVAQ